MSIAFRSATTYNSGGSGVTSVPLNKPSGVVDGDLLVVAIWLQASSGVTPPSGWTTVRTITGTDEMVTYTKVASGEGSSWSWTFSIANANGVCLAFSGAAGVDVENGTTASNSSTPACPSVTTTRANTYVIAIVNHRNNPIRSISSNPSGMTAAATATNNLGEMRACYVEQAGAGASGTKTYTLSNTAFYSTLQALAIYASVTPASLTLAASAAVSTAAAVVAAPASLAPSTSAAATTATLSPLATAPQLALSAVAGLATPSAIVSAPLLIPLSSADSVSVATLAEVGILDPKLALSPVVALSAAQAPVSTAAILGVFTAAGASSVSGTISAPVLIPLGAATGASSVTAILIIPSFVGSLTSGAASSATVALATAYLRAIMGGGRATGTRLPGGTASW